ncbi:unnamed protein product [Aphanomyces euteiches]
MKDDVVVADDEEAHPKNDEEDDNESKHTEEHVATVADHTPDQEDEPSVRVVNHIERGALATLLSIGEESFSVSVLITSGP